MHSGPQCHRCWQAEHANDKCTQPTRNLPKPGGKTDPHALTGRKELWTGVMVSFSDPRNQLSSWECSGQGGRVYSSPISSAARRSMAALASNSSLALQCCNPQLKWASNEKWSSPPNPFENSTFASRWKRPHHISLLILSAHCRGLVPGGRRSRAGSSWGCSLFLEKEWVQHAHVHILAIRTWTMHECWSWPNQWRHKLYSSKGDTNLKNFKETWKICPFRKIPPLVRKFSEKGGLWYVIWISSMRELLLLDTMQEFSSEEQSWKSNVTLGILYPYVWGMASYVNITCQFHWPFLNISEVM